MTVTYEDGQSQRFHYWCQGPKNDSLPTFWLEPGGGHNMCDFFGLQELLVERGRRVCIYDRPGMGWTDYMLPVQPYWYPAMMEKLVEEGEKGPFLLMGWAAGGGIIYSYVQTHPEMVAGMAFMDVAPDSINPEQALNNWTDAQAAASTAQQLAETWQLFDILRGIGSPAGIVGLFYAPKKEGFFPADKYDEYYWHEMTEKYWTTQYFAFKQELATPDPLSNTTFPPNIPVAILISYMNQTSLCNSMNLPLTSKECSDQYFMEDFYFKAYMNMTSLNNHTMARVCEPCDLSFAVYEPYWTVDNLLNTLGNVTI